MTDPTTDDMHAPFVPDSFIEITSTCGNIGRFAWSNQQRFTIEAWGDDGAYERFTNEWPGSCALISTVGDWWAWVWR